MTLRSMFGSYDRKIRKYCKEQIKQGVSEPSALWLCDNYHICSASLTAAKGYLSRKREKELLSLFLLCREIASEGEISEKRILNRLSGKKLTVNQSDALQYLLGAAYSIRAYDAAVNGEDAGEAVKNLIKLRSIDFSALLFYISGVEKYLYDDPEGVYEICSESTKQLYRNAVAKGAKRAKTDEVTFIKDKLSMALLGSEGKRHIGFYLDVMPRRKRTGIIFAVCEWLAATVLALLCTLAFSRSLLIFPFMILPFYSLLKPFGNAAAARIFPAVTLPGLDEDSIDSADTLIAVSCIMPSADEEEELMNHLSELYSSNSRKNVKLVLLADLKSSNVPEDASDKAGIALLKRIADRLNEKHNGGFVVAVRERVYSPTEKLYTGYERKRGAIITLVRYLRDKNDNGFSLVYGDTEGLSDMKYLLALDSDTRLSFESVARLVAAARHPMNIPVVDEAESRVVSGYGIINPLTETSVESWNSTVFSGLFTSGGASFYENCVNERYWDTTGEGIFTGKGLIDIEAFSRTVVDKFDNERILSHDILEGNVMRTAFYPACKLTDSFPGSANSYFLRLHRWIRGDVQNLKYLFAPLGEKPCSPVMSAVGKYQLADNFRRAVSPVNSLALLLLSVFCRDYTGMCFLFASAVLSVASPELTDIVLSLIFNGPDTLRTLYLSRELTGFYKNILRMLFNIASLPEAAFVNADAILRAFYRWLVSKKNLLQWTSAAAAEQSRKRNAIRSVVFPFLCAVLMWISGVGFHRLVALLILLYIPFSLSDGISRRNGKRVLSGNEKRILNSFAASAWRFFEENLTAYENWLPPDNIQETPVPKKAKRTSPTNIGMYLVSCLAASDLFLISSDELYKRIDNTLSTIERMPHYKGLMYNWYDTVRLVPLKPAYVSTVDCGNYLVCLTALKEGLREYSIKDKSFLKLIKRIEKILDSSDMSVLYDTCRKLFRIGIDCESGELSQTYYDLYMSEARMTSFYECARRHVSPKHWESLGRPLKRSGHYVTAASWTGTLFEYFMPVLFMPVISGTFQSEALRVCLYMQKKHCSRRGIPYGISESCYYSVDSSLNYRYKAHGLRSLAVKRSADEERVISPYSVFLTLPFDKDSAMKNLRRLSSLHTEGKCGFYEAVDFTPGRTEGEEYAVVRAYMSHHIGMSIVALCNTLKDDIFVKRFMADKDMKSAGILLEEKLPVHPRVLPGYESREEKTVRRKEAVSRKIRERAVNSSACSNGELTLMYDKYGRNRMVFAGYEIYKYTEISRGISVGFCEYEDEDITTVFPLAEGDVKLEEYGMKSVKNKDGIRVTSALMVHPSGNTLLIPVKAENDSDEVRNIRVFVFFEPRLLPLYDKDRHPAYSDMFITAEKDDKNGVCVFGRSNDENAPTVVAGFCNKEKISVCLDREAVISRKKDAADVFSRSYQKAASAGRGVNPVYAISCDIRLRGNEYRECVLALGVGIGRENALGNFYGTLRGRLPSLSLGASAPFMRDPLIYNFACNFLTECFFGGDRAPVIDAAVNSLSASYNSLWKCGISGDIPIFTVFVRPDCPSELLRAFVRFHKRLAKCSLVCDAVFIFDGNKDYGSTASVILDGVIREEGRADCTGLYGGIHILYTGDTDKDSVSAVTAFSSAVYPDNGFVSQPEIPFIQTLSETIPENDGENAFTSDGYMINRHPLLPWCHTLSNSVFGTLVTDRSLGYTWALNSSCNRLTPWSNNTAEDLTGERLFLKKDGKVYDLTDNASVVFSDTSAVYSSFCGDILVRVRVHVPEKGMIKYIDVQLENKGSSTGELQLFYCAFPVMGENNGDGEFAEIIPAANSVFVRNPLNGSFQGVMAAGSFGDGSRGCDNMNAFFAYDRKCVAILQKFAISDKNSKKIRFFMLYAKSIEAAEKMMLVPVKEKKCKTLRSDTFSKDFDEFVSGLLYHQVRDTRINARCGFYQCSGAFGFRDQLQDALALINRDNRRVRQLIYKACSAQFYEGDVLHWFHPVYTDGLKYKGVRTRCSDDMLWLVYAVSVYIQKTGDRGILDKMIPFTEGKPFDEAQSQVYGEYRLSDKKDTVFFHCLCALNRAFTKGRHSLPLIGDGDWNDSFSRVGIHGQGESVWLAMFIRRVCIDFAKICADENKEGLSRHLLSVAQGYTEAVDKYAWNGRWYIRGFYDDGQPLGDEGCDGCETDILCAAWSVLSDMPDRSRRKQALRSSYERLFDEKNSVVKLFSPPFNPERKMTGYVNFYPEGMRENGGQYTHAAVWFAMALFREGMHDEGRRVLDALLPNVKYKNGRGDIYKTEPYALCGDVYSAKGMEGRGGWSLYTGSAGWLVQLASEIGE